MWKSILRICFHGSLRIFRWNGTSCGFVLLHSIHCKSYPSIGRIIKIFKYASEFKFGSEWEIGESFWCGNAGTALIWFFTFVDCICFSQNYRKVKTVIKSNAVTAEELEMNLTTVQTKNPYDDIE